MKKWPDKKSFALISTLACTLALAGCSTAGRTAADVALASAGGLAGYELTDKKVGGAVAGAAVGYIASKVAQSEIQTAVADAEQRGYDRALNQAVKQQYWIIQNQQQSRAASPEAEPRLVPVVVPATNINGVVQEAHVEYLRISP